jgi:nucleoside-diphosphate-sugar epimerase
VERGQKRGILITGARGFIGSEVVLRFSESREFELCLLIGRNFFQKDSELADSYRKAGKVFCVDIGDEDAVCRLEEIGKIEAVIHCAGLAHQFGQVSEDDFFRVNVKGTINICRLAKKLKAEYFFLMSSVAVYGNQGPDEVEESFSCQPCGSYAESKRKAEIEAERICGEEEMGLIILRLGTVIGEGDPGNLLRLIMQIDKKKFLWIGKGKNKKSLIYKRDVAEILYSLVNFYLGQKKKHFDTFNIVAQPMAMEEIVRAIYRGMGKKMPEFHISSGVVKSVLRAGEYIGLTKFDEMSKTLEKWLSNDIYSSRKLKEVHSLEAKTDVREAIMREVIWYLADKEKQKKA